MTTLPKYKTTANGSIDYAHYDLRAREIRSKDAWCNIGSIGKALGTLATMFRRAVSSGGMPISTTHGRAPLRTPQKRRAHPTTSRVNAEAAGG